MSSGISAGAISIIPPNNPVTKTASSISVAGVTIHTVTTGKTFYCTGMTFQNVEAGAVDYTLKVAGTSKIITNAPVTTSINLSGQPIFAATSGQAVTLHGGATYTVYTTLWGFEL